MDYQALSQVSRVATTALMVALGVEPQEMDAVFAQLAPLEIPLTHQACYEQMVAARDAVRAEADE